MKDDEDDHWAYFDAIAQYRAAHPEQASSGNSELLFACGWVQQSDGYFETACRNAFEFNDGGPDENGFRYCPYCGNVLEIELFDSE